VTLLLYELPEYVPDDFTVGGAELLLSAQAFNDDVLLLINAHLDDLCFFM
jgi:hypothetical protein